MAEKPGLRIGEAAEALGVRVETLRRWERDGRLRTTRSKGGQRLVPASELARLAKQRRTTTAIGAQSARNHFEGVVTAVKKDGLVATVELLSGHNRILALTTREAVDDMKLRPGMRAIAAVKATNVIIELPV